MAYELIKILKYRMQDNYRFYVELLICIYIALALKSENQCTLYTVSFRICIGKRQKKVRCRLYKQKRSTTNRRLIHNSSILTFSFFVENPLAVISLITRFLWYFQPRMVVIDIMDFEKKNYFYALRFLCQTLGIRGNRTHIKSCIAMVSG